MSVPNPALEDYARLRSAYESAFRDFTIQVRRFQTLLHQPGLAQILIGQARRQLAEAEQAYRRSRDRLAEHVLSHGAPPSA